MGTFTNQPEFATAVAAITPSDTIDGTTKLNGAALQVGTAGDVNVILSGQDSSAGAPTAADAVVFKNVGNGCFLPIICDYVLATGTGATNILSVK